MIKAINDFTHKTNKSFSYFLFIFLILALADAIMAYSTPVFLKSKINNQLLIGLVLACSSVVGFTLDIFAGAYLKNRSFKFFLVATSLIAILFPVSLIFSANFIFLYIIAMGFWGIYFELRAFSVYNYIKYSIPKSSYPYAWSILEIVVAIAYLLGPLIASSLIDYSLYLPFKLAIILFTLGLFFTLINFKKNKRNIFKNLFTEIGHNSLNQEFKVWKILSSKIWAVWVMWFLIWCLDASIWSAGVLLSEKLRHQFFQAEFLIPIYVLPRLFVGFIVSSFQEKIEHKKLAFMASAVSGLSFILLGFSENINLILFLVFIGATSLTTSIVLLATTFEDYIRKLGEHGNELIGLEQTASSLGYIISPILTFLIIGLSSEKTPFIIWGTILIIWAVFSFFYVPKIIRMPQKILKNINFINKFQ